MSGKNVQGFSEDADGNLWIATRDRGGNFIDRKLKNLWDDPEHQQVKSKLAKRVDRCFEEIDKPAILFGDANE